jgi:Undecaprenyl-phosphate glucose phosphotransferase
MRHAQCNHFTKTMADRRSTAVIDVATAAWPGAAAAPPPPETGSAPANSAPPARRNAFFASEAGVVSFVRFLDVFAFGAVAAILFSSYISVAFAGRWDYVAAVTIATALIVSLNTKFGLYDFDTISAWPRRMIVLIGVMAIVEAVLVGLGFALKVSEQFSRVWVFGTFLLATVAMVLGRGAVLFAFRRSARAGAFRRNVAIVGASDQAEAFITGLNSARAPWQTIVGIFDDRLSRIAPTVAGCPVVGTLDALVAQVRAGLIDVVVVALPWSADARLLAIIRELRELPVHVYLSPDLIAYRFPAHTQELLAGVSVLKIAAAPLSGSRAVVKAIEDYVLGALALIIAAPVMLVCAIAVKLDSPGPVLFRQVRYGFNNRPITVIKFRSMVANRPTEVGVPQATRDDPRVTRVGRFLRRTSLDELPQLFNVINGSMSLVGPRPHAVEHNEMYERLIQGYSGRHRVKPGITGWAQVNGLRGETDTLEKMAARVRYDIDYVERWSLWLDLRILLRTLFIAWRQPTAY